MLRRLLGLSLFFLASSAAAANFPAQAPFDLDAAAARALQAYDVPGLSVAIVKDGKVLAAKGYGVRKLGAPAAVDGDTLFGIASNTKAFTTTALAMLVDERKLAWDDPVIKYLPSFAMNDPWVTREMTIRDLVTHRSGLGLGEGDLLWWPQTDYSRDEIVHRLRYLKPATSFRSGYAYDNVLYLVAGQIVAAVSGRSWEDFVRERILNPLAMTSTATGIARAAVKNVATPHALVDGRLMPVAHLPIDNMAPCCGMVSSAGDMAKWMLAQLDHRLVSESQAQELWSAQTVQPREPPAALFQAYALGWSVRDYRGQLVVTHNGGLLGMTSRVLLVPALKLGVTVLTNQDDRAAADAIAWSVVDSWIGPPVMDWIATIKPVEKIAAPAIVTAPRAGAPLSAYAGRYRDAWYGDATVALEKGRLLLRFAHTPLLTGALEPLGDGRFVARWKERSLNADAFATFSDDGHLRLEPVSPLVDFSFDFHDLDFSKIEEQGAH